MKTTESTRDSDATSSQDAAPRSGRRAFLGVVGAATGAVTVLTIGQSFPGLSGTNVFGPRDGKGPRGCR